MIITIIITEEKDTKIKGQDLYQHTVYYTEKKCYSVSSAEEKTFMETPKQQLPYIKPRKETAQLLVVSVTPFKIDQNKLKTIR